jgi:FAD/FMN-containing dehydrogenase
MTSTPFALTDPVLAELRARVRGRVLTPADPDWAAASTAWNLAVAQRPAAVVEVADAADAAALVGWARERGAVVAAQPRGHGATAALDGTVLIRPHALDEILLDAPARVARVGSGVRWGDLLEALDGTGLIAPAGSNPDVSVVGLLLGGGVSWFARRHGYAAHSLRAVEIVDGDGRLRWVSDDSDPDLMWALRGGGGDIAVVTRVELDLHPADGLHGGKLMFPITDAPAVLAAFLVATRTAPRELTLWASLVHFPPVPFLPEQVRGKSFVTVDSTFVGAAEEYGGLLAPVRAAGSVLADTTAELAIGRLGEVTQEPTDPAPAIAWGTLLRELTPQTLERLVAAAGTPGSTALVSVQLRHLGGALAEGPRGAAGAAAHSVAEPYLLWALGIAAVPEMVDPIRASLSDLSSAVAPVATDRVPPTLLAGGEPLARAFDAATLARLQAVKAQVDPAGTIRGNHPLGGAVLD